MFLGPKIPPLRISQYQETETFSTRVIIAWLVELIISESKLVLKKNMISFPKFSNVGGYNFVKKIEIKGQH